MRICIIHEVYVPTMGYAATLITKELARLGHDVHYITAGLPPYYYFGDFNQTYASFIKETPPAGSAVKENGYTVHYVPFKKMPGGMRLTGLSEKLNELNPDIVQTFAHSSWHTLDAILFRGRKKYRIFTGNHTTKSVYPLARDGLSRFSALGIRETLLRFVPGRLMSYFIEKCYGATIDCSELAIKYFGVPRRKVITIPLGVDTDIFYPVQSEEDREARTNFRRAQGVADNEVLCIYTGRFSEEKNPLLLAKAVAKARSQGETFRAIFVGDGVQKAAIEACDGCTVLPFVHFSELGTYYRGADIGVWPTQESTSMIDAAACGKPILVNDTLLAKERVEGNGLRYKLNDLDDLVAKLLELKDPVLRETLGSHGAEKMKQNYSWKALVQQRIQDYQASMSA